MRGFIIYPTYRIRDGKAFVHLFGRLENGDSFETITNLRPYFFILADNLDLAKSLFPYLDFEDTNMKTFDGLAVTKVVANIPREVLDIRKLLESNGVKCYEADIRFAYRLLIDKKLKGSINIEGEFKKGVYVDRVYCEPKLSPSDFKPELNILSIDIETDSKAKQLYSISLVMGNKVKNLVITDEVVENAESFLGELSLLKRFQEVVIDWDPDIITGWNVIDFDLGVLFQMFKRNNLPFLLGRSDSPCSLRLESSFFIDSKANFQGRQVLDGIQLLKTSFISLQNYKLNTAAKELLGEEKLITVSDSGKEITRLYNDDVKNLIAYNQKDAELVLKIFEKTGVVDLTIQRSLLTGMPLDRVKATIASFDMLYIVEGHDNGLVSPSVGDFERTERIKGGFVRESIPGIYDYILVLDFKSLYPSIIRTFNIDPASFVAKGDDVIEAPNGAKFKNVDGLLPQIIQRLWKQRDAAKGRKDKGADVAIKLLMNSLFGALANPSCRYYSLELGNAITSYGQSLIKRAASKVEELGYQVIYGDTDSIFVNSKATSYEEAEMIGKTIQDSVNKFFTEIVSKEYRRENFMELEFEKIFIKFFMPRGRNSDVGSKKRYAGLVLKNGKAEMSFTGMEFVRRDWTDLSKKFQLELFDRVFHGKDVKDYIKSFIQDLLKGRFDDLLIYRKAIRKDLASYVKTTPPHVKAARKLKELTSNIIEYLMTVDGPQPIQEVTSKIDYEHYIEKQIRPIAGYVLDLYDLNFDDLKEGKQKNLFDF